VREVAEWRERPPRDLPGLLYDHWDPKSREQVDLSTFPLRDDDGREIPVYDEWGYRFARLTPAYNSDQMPCAPMADLTLVARLFQNHAMYGEDMEGEEVMGEEEEEGEEEKANERLYPQGYTRRYGYFQADRMPTVFQSFVRQLNVGLVHNVNPEEPAVEFSSFQAYNHTQHTLTRRAGGLEVVHGKITSCLAGTSATTPSARRSFEKCRSEMNRLPFDRVAKKLRKEDIPRGFRLEHIATVNLQVLQDEYRNGR
jgi:hypothetical protein